MPDISRRQFILATTAATCCAGVSRAYAANERITLGCIGTGNHGTGWNLEAFLPIPEARVLAVCDVFEQRRENARQMVNRAYGNQDCTAHRDFREILNNPTIDAVVISTPDHWHVLMSVMAARAGKHVFCEKPTLNIAQGKVLVKEIKQAGIVYQGGIEDRSVEQYHRLAELVRNGIIGKLERIRVKLPPGEVFAREDPVPVPEGLDYDLWLGPAPQTPYSPSKTDAQVWRNQWDYSGGKLTDWGAHLMDTAQVAIYEHRGGPVEIDGKGEFPVGALSNTATKYDITYRYANGVTMEVKSLGTGIRFEGSEGWVQCPSWRAPLEASDPAILEVVIPPSENKMWKRPPSEHVDFISAVKDGSTTVYPPEDIHRLSTAMHLGNISMRLGRKLQWDPKTEQIISDEEAKQFLSCPMREPWNFETTV